MPASHLTHTVHSAQEAQRLNKLLGTSPVIKSVKAQIDAASKSDVSVAITGETGTGKELAAKLLHFKSHRENNAFVALDCGTISDELAESELFGYEKGAFTGADRQKIGLMEKAHNGTLFLDEVTNLPDSVQRKLLRTIQERKIRRLGSQVERNINIRIITASNQPLFDAVEQGAFRKDLFYRLYEFPLIMPPLKERKADIPHLAHQFVKEFCTQQNLDVRSLAPEAMEKLVEYDWPGNVRELQNAIKRAALMAKGDAIALIDLPEEIVLAKENKDGMQLDNSYSLAKNLDIVKRKTEKNLIEKALQKTDGNKTQAAKLLEIDRKSLYTKMAKYNIFE